MAVPTDDVERWSAFKVWLFGLFNRTPKSNLAVVEHARLTADDRLLDVGCGLGAALEHAVASGAALAGVDPSPAMVDKASRRVPRAEVKVGSAESIPFPDSHFTVVINVSSYHHWAHPETGLSEILRVLAPGGRLLIVEHDLKRKTGHGLNQEQADRLSETLIGVGFASSAVDSLKAGRSRYMVVSATAPT